MKKIYFVIIFLLALVMVGNAQTSSLGLIRSVCDNPPTNVQSIIDNGSLTLTWNAVGNEVISQATDTVRHTSLGLGNSSYSFGAYHLFTSADLSPYDGSAVTSIGGCFTGTLLYTTYTIRIWVGGSDTTGPASIVPVYEQVISPDEVTSFSGWSDIVLDTPYVIDASQALWIGYQCDVNAPTSDGYYVYPAGVTDNQNANDGYGNVVHWGGNWTTLTALGSYSFYNCNWMIRAHVVGPDISYNILSDSVVIASGIHGTEYVITPYDTSACYQVSTSCEGGQMSAPSDCATPFYMQPSVNTMQVYNITAFSAYCQATLQSDGHDPSCTRGVCWSTSTDPDIQDNCAIYDGNEPRGPVYTVIMGGLHANTIYYVRAFATNALGTVYGEELSFTTDSCELTMDDYLTIHESDLPYTYGDTVFMPGTVQNGEFTFNYTSVDGCDSVVTLHLTIETGVNDYLTLSVLDVYPNPAKDKVNVQLVIKDEHVDDVEIQLYDMYGRRLSTWKMKGEMTEIDLSSFASGVYFFKAFAGRQLLGARKIVKQ